MFLSPKGAQFISMGHRPMNGSSPLRKALKERNP